MSAARERLEQEMPCLPAGRQTFDAGDVACLCQALLRGGPDMEPPDVPEVFLIRPNPARYALLTPPDPEVTTARVQSAKVVTTWPAAEERGWAVIMIDARMNVVVLEEPTGSNSLTIRLQGRDLDADFIRQMPEAVVWRDEDPSPAADQAREGVA